jgi:hypothetical protein
MPLAQFGVRLGMGEDAPPTFIVLSPSRARLLKEEATS